MRRTTAGRAAIMAGALLSFVSCTSAPVPQPGPSPPPTPLVGLAEVPLPDGLQPSALAVNGSDLIVAGRIPTAADRRPATAIVHDGTVRSVRVSPASPYGKVADLVSVAADGSKLAALGAAHGGAHSNFRWTVWTGTTRQLTDRPQTFETFGGWNAGSLTAVVDTGRGPRIVGSWQGASALDIAIWQPAPGNRWVRLDSSGTPLANTPTLQVSGRSAASRRGGMIITGSVIDLSDGVHQVAAAWLSPDDTNWQLVRLPEPGRRSEALSAHCSADSCWLAGHVDGRLALWSLDGDRATRATRTTRVTDLPDIPIDVDGPFPQVIGPQMTDPQGIGTGSRPVAAYSADGTTSVLARTSNGWTVHPGPKGSLAASAQLDGQIYLVTDTSPDRSELWTAQAP